MTLNVLEIRNYLLKPQMREHFIDYFEEQFIASQYAANMHVLGQFCVIGAPDHFVWLRGYEDMQARLKALEYFYNSDFWYQRRPTTNSMLVDSDNVHLLRPLLDMDLLDGHSAKKVAEALTAGIISPETGVIAIDFYLAVPNQWDALFDAFQTQVAPAYKDNGIHLRGVFGAEMGENMFKRSPVIQIEAEVVVITAYKDEAAARKERAKAASVVDAAFDGLLAAAPETLLLSPTLRSPLRYNK